MCFSYYTFDVSFWRLHTADSLKRLPLFIGPMLQFVEEDISRYLCHMADLHGSHLSLYHKEPAKDKNRP